MCVYVCGNVCMCMCVAMCVCVCVWQCVYRPLAAYYYLLSSEAGVEVASFNLAWLCEEYKVSTQCSVLTGFSVKSKDILNKVVNVCGKVVIIIIINY